MSPWHHRLLRVYCVLAVLSACDPDGDTPASDSGLSHSDARPGPLDGMTPSDVSVGMAGDPSRTDRLLRAAARICREVCACTGRVYEGESTTRCHFIPESCCTYQVGYTKETGGCEYEFAEKLERAARACDRWPVEDCFCESLEHCLDWMERTECPRDRAPLRDGLVVPRTCVDLDPSSGDRCCDWERTNCELLESTLAAERAGAFVLSPQDQHTPTPENRRERRRLRWGSRAPHRLARCSVSAV
jgi:hypothetical protein